MRARKKTLCRSNCLAYSPAEVAERMLFGEVNVVLLLLLLLLGFYLRNQRDLRETSGVSSVWIAGVLSCEYSPADNADHAEECSKLHYFAEKDRLFEVVAVKAVLLFWVSSAIICERHFGFHLC